MCNYLFIFTEETAKRVGVWNCCMELLYGAAVWSCCMELNNFLLAENCN